MGVMSFLGGVALLILLGVALLIAFVFRRVVPTNRVDIVQSSKATKSYGKGRLTGNTYYAWPSFLPFVGVTVTHFPESVFNVTLKDYAAYDLGRLPFLVDIMGFYRIADSDKAAHRVANFDELQTQLRGVMESIVRSVLGSERLEVILSDRVLLAKAFTDAVNASLEEWGVTTVKDIAFMDIRDANSSLVIANIMAKEQSRIEMESRSAVATNHQAAQTAEINAAREVGMRQQEAALQVGQKQAATEKAVGIAQEQAKQEIQTQAKITAEKDMEVKQVTDVRTAEINRNVAEVQADQNRKVEVVNADATRQQTELVATGNLSAAKLEAEGIRVKGEAQGKAREAVLQAEVSPQITLAKEIGTNEGYQTYLIKIEQVKATQAVGMEQAKALMAADVKVIVNGGDVQSGIGSIGDLISSKGGQALASVIEGLMQTEQGAALAGRITGKASAKPGKAASNAA